MPIVRLHDGSRLQIPDHGRHRAMTQHLKSDGSRVRVEYEFDMDIGEVRVDTYRDPVMHWGAGSELEAQEIKPPKRIGVRGVQGIRDFLEGAGDPYAQGPSHPEEKEHWTREYIRNPLEYKTSLDPYMHKVPSKMEHEEWNRQEIKMRGLRDAYGGTAGEKLVRKKATRLPRNHENEELVKEKGESVPHLATGTRIRMNDPLGKEKYAFGTVVELSDPTHKSYSLVCMDVPGTQFTDHPEVCGEDYGLYVAHRELRDASGNFKSRSERFEGIPQHIGMYNPEAFSYDGRDFPRNSVGRVVEINGERATLEWRNVKGLEGRAFHVPKDCLRWCRFNPETNKIQNQWYSSLVGVGEGEILVYWSDKPHMVAGMDGGHPLTKGVMCQHVGYDPERCCVKAKLLSGVPQEILGTTVKLPKQSLRKFEGVFVPVGVNVEIVAELTFRKRNLQGSKAKVILATDCEGDVGIQFPEDIGAGSLDGIGKEGRCLYVPSDYVGIVSE